MHEQSYIDRPGIQHWDWNRLTGWAMLTMLALVFTLIYAAIATGTSRAALELAYDKYIDTPVERNEWGQLQHTPEFMCEASIRQWLENCGKE